MANIQSLNILSGKAWFKLGLFLMGGSLILLGIVPGVQAQSSNDLSNRLSRIENELETLNRAVYRGEAPPRVSSANPSLQAELEVRIQQLEGEMRELRGKIEEQNNRLNLLESTVSALSPGAAGNPASASAQTPAPRIVAPQEPPVQQFRWSSSADDGGAGDESVEDFNAPAAQAPALPQPQADISAGAPANQLGTLQQTVILDAAGNVEDATPPSDQAADAYENAFALLKNSQYEQAAAGFQDFIAAYPDHPLTGNAQYWLGETFYVRDNFERAARIFAEGYRKYPTGSKAADNLLKLGMSLGALDNKDDACVALRQLEKDFSEGPVPVLRRAEQEMQKLGCS